MGYYDPIEEMKADTGKEVNVQPISANGFLYCLCYFSLAAA